MPESTLDVWLVDRGREPLVHAVRPEERGWTRLPFVGVIEAYVLRALRDFGLPMEDIRKAAELVREEFDDPYALAFRRIVTDGVALFVRGRRVLVHARDRQLGIPQILEAHLKNIEWKRATPPDSICATSPKPPTSSLTPDSDGALRSWPSRR